MLKLTSSGFFSLGQNKKKTTLHWMFCFLFNSYLNFLYFKSKVEEKNVQEANLEFSDLFQVSFMLYRLAA